jgi:hypothetical protein
MAEPPLSAAELAQFKEFGFVIKRGYLDPVRASIHLGSRGGRGGLRILKA